MAVRSVQLGEIAEILVGYPTKRHYPAAAQRSEKVLSVRALKDTGIDRQLMAEVVEARTPGNKYRVRPGDVLVPARSTAFKPCIVPNDLDGTVFNATLICIRCLPKLKPSLLLAYLLSEQGLEAVRAITHSGTAQMNVTASSLAQLVVPFSPSEHQERLADLLEWSETAYIAALEAARCRRELARHIVVQRMLTQNPENNSD